MISSIIFQTSQTRYVYACKYAIPLTLDEAAIREKPLKSKLNSKNKIRFGGFN